MNAIVIFTCFSTSAGSDYESINETITFDVEDLQYEGTLIITDNDALENVEQMFLQIEALPGLFPLVVVDDTAVVTITDNDGEKHLTLVQLVMSVIHHSSSHLNKVASKLYLTHIILLILFCCVLNSYSCCVQF